MTFAEINYVSYFSEFLRTVFASPGHLFGIQAFF